MKLFENVMMTVRQEDGSLAECYYQNELVNGPFIRLFPCTKGTKMIGTKATYYIAGKVVRLSKPSGRLMLTEVEVQGFVN